MDETLISRFLKQNSGIKIINQNQQKNNVLTEQFANQLEKNIKLKKKTNKKFKLKFQKFENIMTHGKLLKMHVIHHWFVVMFDLFIEIFLLNMLALVEEIINHFYWMLR